MDDEAEHDVSKAGGDGGQAAPADGEDMAEILADDTPQVLDHHAERALTMKFDLRLLVVLAIMYLFNGFPPRPGLRSEASCLLGRHGQPLTRPTSAMPRPTGLRSR